MYKTSVFNIKYIEEETDLSEVVSFTHIVSLPKLDISDDVRKQLSAISVPLLMEVAIYFSEDQAIFALEKDIEVDYDEVLPEVKYTKVGSKTYRLGDMMAGIYKFVPVEFPLFLSSVMYTSVH